MGGADSFWHVQKPSTTGRQGCSNMNSTSFITLFTYMLRQNVIRFYEGRYATFKLAPNLKLHTLELSLKQINKILGQIDGYLFFWPFCSETKNHMKNPDVRIGYGKMLMSANCNIQRRLSIFVFFRRRDQLINLFPNKMLTWGRQILLTFAISLVRHTDAEVCEETTMTLLIYRHSLKKSANYTVYLTQSWNKFARKNHSVATVTPLVMAIGKRGTQRGEFYSLDKIFSTLCLCWCIHVAYESTFFQSCHIFLSTWVEPVGL